MKKIVFMSLFIIIILSSCDNVSDFLFETDQAVEIRSIENGSLYKGGESFPVTIVFDRTVVPESLTISIFDGSGKSWGETHIAIPEAIEEYTTSLIIPEELPRGKYIFHITLFENEKEISFKELILFKTDSDYIIDQLTSLPHETEAGKDVFIKADIDYPENTDPFFRWSLKGSVLKEGFLSEGMNTLHWMAEEDNGLYLIRLDIFPEFCTDTMESSVFATTEIVVSDNPLKEKNPLYPEEEYSLLFHFAGDIYPSQKSQFTIVESGLLESLTYNNNLVYPFSGENGMSVSGSLIPHSAEQVTPFSINGRIGLPEGFAGGNLLHLSDEVQDLFSLSIGNEGNMIFTVNGQSSESLFHIMGMVDFSLQIIPLSDSIEIKWFYNGNNGGSTFLEANFPSISSIQKAVIGGIPDRLSADLYLDELGIYVNNMDRSSVDENQFKRIKSYIFRENLIEAEGFDSEGGSLRVDPGEKILLNSFFQSIKDTELVLSFPMTEKEESLNVILENEEGVELFRAPLSSAVINVDNRTGLSSKKLKISLFPDEENKQVEIIGNTLLNRAVKDYEPGEMISLFLETDVENSSALLLDFYIIYSNPDSFTLEKIVAAEEKEDLL